MLYAKWKSNVEDEPFEETLSVVFLLYFPPKSRTSPDLSPQQRCQLLSFTSFTGNEVKLAFPSNFSQDFSGCLGPYPPHTMLLHIVSPGLGLFGFTEQVRLVLGLNISKLLVLPPTMMIPDNIYYVIIYRWHIWHMAIVNWKLKIKEKKSFYFWTN